MKQFIYMSYSFNETIIIPLYELFIYFESDNMAHVNKQKWIDKAQKHKSNLESQTMDNSDNYVFPVVTLVSDQPLGETSWFLEHIDT